MKKKIRKRLGAFLLLALAVIATVEVRKAIRNRQPECENGICPLPAEKEAARYIGPQNVPTSVFKDESDSKPLPTLLDFGAGQCANCKLMDVVLDKLATEYAEKIRVRSVNVHDQEALTEQYGVRMIPTQVFLDADGNELFRHEGFLSEKDIADKWNELGISLANE